MMAGIAYSGDYRRELDVAIEAGQQAADVILDFYSAASAETYVKNDGSPVTDADLASDTVIRDILSHAFPEDALLTEEGAKNLDRLERRRVWIVDPIDGTAEYVKHTGLFDVLIALAIDGEPVVAVSVHPVDRHIQAAVISAGAWEIHDGQAERFMIGPSLDPPRIVTSKWYGGLESPRGDAVRRITVRLGSPPAPVMEIGYQSRAFSAAVRRYDGYIGLPPAAGGSIAQEWDLACVDLITREAGGAFTDCWGRRHRYNKRSTGISGGVMASADPKLHAQMLEATIPELPARAPALDPADDGY